MSQETALVLGFLLGVILGSIGTTLGVLVAMTRAFVSMQGG